MLSALKYIPLALPLLSQLALAGQYCAESSSTLYARSGFLKTTIIPCLTTTEDGKGSLLLYISNPQYLEGDGNAIEENWVNPSTDDELSATAVATIDGAELGSVEEEGTGFFLMDLGAVPEATLESGPHYITVHYKQTGPFYTGYTGTIDTEPRFRIDIE